MIDRLYAILHQKNHHWAASLEDRDDDELAKSYRSWLASTLAQAPREVAASVRAMFVEGRVDESILKDADEALLAKVVHTCMEGHVRWHRYRDALAIAMGMERDAARTAPPPMVHHQNAPPR